MISINFILQDKLSAESLAEELIKEKLVATFSIHSLESFQLFDKHYYNCSQITAVTKALLYTKIEKRCKKNTTILHLFCLPVTNTTKYFSEKLIDQTQKT